MTHDGENKNIVEKYFMLCTANRSVKSDLKTTLKS